jgi:hypothetical protein
MWAFGLYAVSAVIFLIGLYLLHAPQIWIVVGALVILLLGGICAITHLKARGRSGEGQEL